MHIATKVLELSFLLLHEVLPGGNDHRLLSTVLMHLGLDVWEDSFFVGRLFRLFSGIIERQHNGVKD
jgi:hypothetical protein